MGTAAGSITPDQRADWAITGFLLVREAVPVDLCGALAASGDAPAPPAVGRLLGHRVTGLVDELVGRGADLLDARVVTLGPGEPGRLWHQAEVDGEAGGAVERSLLLHLALTDADLTAGCPWVLPATHTEPARPHVRDTRPGSAGFHARRRIVGVDRAAARPVPLRAGDLLVLDGLAVHRWGDNHSRAPVAALLCRYGVRAPEGAGPAAAPERVGSGSGAGR